MSLLATKARRTSRVLILTALVSAAVPGQEQVNGQTNEALEKGRALYQSAAYMEAIDVLAGSIEAEALQYRALSLLALRRTDEAQATMDLLVRTAPTFVPSSEDLPPRFLALFQESRSRALPDAIRALLTDGREKFQAKSYEAAQRQFEQAQRLAGDAAAAGAPGIEDLRTLAASYLDLVKETVAVRAAAQGGTAAPAASNGVAGSSTGAGPVAAGAAATPVSAASFPATSSPAASSPATASSPAASPGPAAAPARDASVPATAAVVTNPRAVRQQIPPWPSVAGSREAGATGAVRITIGEDGRVKKASIERRLHPLYDLQLLAAAQSWLYEPATLNGRPVQVDKVIEITP